MNDSKNIRQAGISLVEMMVGIAIGLVCVVVMFQVMQMWESNRRTSTSGSEAQIVGSVASFQFERDLKLAGMGFGTADELTAGCSVNWQNTNLGLTAQTFTLAPVVITPGATAGDPVTVDILYGNSSYFVSNENVAASQNAAKTIGAQAGFNLGDLAVYAGVIPSAPGYTCGLIQVTGLPNDLVTLTHDLTPFVNPSAKPVPPATTVTAAASFYNTATTPAGYSKGPIYNLGPAPHLNRWTLNGTNLQWTNVLSSTDVNVVAQNVVNFQAEYLMTPVAGGLPEVPLTPPVTGTDWRRLKGIRYAMIVRQPEYLPYSLYGNGAGLLPNPSWAGGAFVMRNIDGTTTGAGGDINDWTHYRYKVYEGTLTLRNMVWATL